MAEFDDLINEFGSKGKASPVVTPYADLISEFGSGSIKAVAKAPYDPTEVPMSGYTPEQQAQRRAEVAEAQKPKPIDPTKWPIVRQGIEGFKSGREMAGEGYADIARSAPASGVGKVVLGHTIQALNVLPILPTIEVGTEQLAKISGNPDFAKRAELVATSGLPIAKAAKVVTGAMPSTRALNTIVDAIGVENIPAAITQLKSNPRLTLMDIDPNVQVISQGLAAKPGEPRNILDKVVAARKDTQKGVVTDAYDEAMGVPVNVKDKVDSLKTQIKETGKEINPIIAASKPVDMTGVVASIDSKLKPGVNSVISMGEPLPLVDIQKDLVNLRKFITDNKSFRTDPQSLHNFQSALRAKAEDLLSSSNGQDRQRGYAMMNVRNQVVDAIDAAGETPGSYKAALAKYRDVNDVNDAFKKGQLVTRNRLGNLDDNPAYWEEWISKATPAELEAAREGARLAVAHQMSSIPNAARKGMTIPEIEFNSEKLKLLFGKEEVEKMAKALADEKKIADTNSKLFQNSQTAMRMLGAEATAVRPDYSPQFTKTILPLALEGGTLYLSQGNIPAIGALAGLTYPYVRGKITKMGQALDRKTNVEIANLSSATGEAREALIQALQDRVPKAKLSLAQKSILALPIAKP